MQPAVHLSTQPRVIIGPAEVITAGAKLNPPEEPMQRLARMPDPVAWAFTREFAGAAASLCFYGQVWHDSTVVPHPAADFLGRLGERFQEIAGTPPLVLRPAQTTPAP